MWKIAFSALCLTLIAAAPALATGVDQVIYGGEEIQPLDDGLGKVYLPNEDYLYKQGGADSGDGAGDDGYGDLPDGVGGDGYDQPIGDDGGNAPVPEPGTGILLGVGVLGLARYIRRRRAS